MADMDAMRRLSVEKKWGVHLPTREKLRSMPRKSVLQKSTLNPGRATIFSS